MRNIDRNLVMIAKLGMAAVILGYVFSKVGLHTVLVSISHAQFRWLAVAFAAAIATQIFTAARLRSLIAPHAVELTLLNTFFINLAGIFYGLFLPAGNVTGLAVRFYKLARLEDRYSWAVAALLADRITATFTLCLVGLVMLAGDQSVSSPEAFLVLAVGLAGTTLLLMPIFSRTAIIVLRRIEKAVYVGWIRKAVCTADETLTPYHRLPIRTVFRIFIYSVSAHLFGLMAYYFVARSMDLKLSLVSLGWTRSVLILITMIPITFSGLGLREVTAIVLLGGLGVSQAQATGFSILVFALTVLGVGILGGGYEGIRLLRNGSSPKA